MMATGWGQVSFDRILASGSEPQNWLTYSGSTMSQRYSTLNQITPDNVKNLELQWQFQARSLEKFEATPLVVDGILYTVQAPNNVVALDAVTGRVFWTLSLRPGADGAAVLRAGESRPRDSGRHAVHGHHRCPLDCPGRQERQADLERGCGESERRLCADARPAGGQRQSDRFWDKPGGEYGIRGFIAAYDVKTGNEAWRFYTIPGKGGPGNETWKGDSWQHGGASVWVTGSYDPALNLTYWGIGNPVVRIGMEILAMATIYIAIAWSRWIPIPES